MTQSQTETRQQAVAALVLTIAQSLVEHPEQCTVLALGTSATCLIEIACAMEDCGRIIGKHRTRLEAIQVLARAAAKQEFRVVEVELAGAGGLRAVPRKEGC